MENRTFTSTQEVQAGHIGAAAFGLHRLNVIGLPEQGDNPSLLNGTTALTQEVAANYIATMDPMTDRFAVFSMDAFGAWTVAEIISDQERAIEVAVAIEGVYADWILSAAAEHTQQISDALALVPEIPKTTTKEAIEKDMDSLLWKLPNVQIDPFQTQENEKTFTTDGSTIYTDNENAKKTPEQIAAEIFEKLTAANIGSEITLDQLFRVLPSIKRELQKLGKNYCE